MTEIDPEKRSRASAGNLCRAQDRAVATEHDHELEVAGLHGVAEQCDGCQVVSGRQDVSVLVRGQHRSEPARDELPTDTDRGFPGLFAPGVGHDEDVPLTGHGRYPSSSNCGDCTHVRFAVIAETC